MTLLPAPETTSGVLHRPCYETNKHFCDELAVPTLEIVRPPAPRYKIRFTGSRYRNPTHTTSKDRAGLQAVLVSARLGSGSAVPSYDAQPCQLFSLWYLASFVPHGSLVKILESLYLSLITLLGYARTAGSHLSIVSVLLTGDRGSF